MYLIAALVKKGEIMNKIRKTFIVGLMLLLMSSATFAATYTTSKEVMSGGFKIRASAIWEYETGIYLGKGTHKLLEKPSGGIYDIGYNLTHKTSNYEVTQYFNKLQYYAIRGEWDIIGNVRIDFSSPGHSNQYEQVQLIL